MRRQRMSTSCSVLLRAWPMCRAPVTFGGGMTMVNGFAAGSGSAVEVAAARPRTSSHFCWASFGSYAFGEFGRHDQFLKIHHRGTESTEESADESNPFFSVVSASLCLCG